jgi:phenylpyruvate tautomerase PptA (4-oxalocrotonate tautomerase family)
MESMPQVKIYSTAEHLADSPSATLRDRRNQFMAALNDSFLEVTGIAAEKIVYRFFPMAPEDLCALGDRTDRFTVVEITIFAGRSAEVKTQLIETIFVQVEKRLQLTVVDLEIMLWEIPPSNYGLRGTTGEKLLARP